MTILCLVLNSTTKSRYIKYPPDYVKKWPTTLISSTNGSGKSLPFKDNKSSFLHRSAVESVASLTSFINLNIECNGFAKKDNITVKEHKGQKRSLISRRRRRQADLIGHIMGTYGLEHLITMGKLEVETERGNDGQSCSMV